MDEDLVCVCGKSFTQPGGLSNHRRACASSKNHVATALQKARAAWQAKKRKPERAEASMSSSTGDATGSTSASQAPRAAKVARTSTQTHPVNSIADARPPQQHLSSMLSVLETTLPESGTRPAAQSPNLPMAATQVPQQRTRYGRQVVVPAIYRDLLPATLAPIPRSTAAEIHANDSENSENTPTPPSETMPEASCPSHAPNPPPNAAPFRTPRNAFGLYGQYDVKPNLTHLPNEELTEDDLSDITPSASTSASSAQDPSRPAYWPYPNESSFMLGEWFWTGGQQKSKAEFSKLIDILTDSHFSLDDIRAAPWDHFDAKLGESTEDPWIDEFEDAGWIREELHISVPFHNQMALPGPKNFYAGHFYRRSIISVMKERISREDARNLHFDPFELYWKPDDSKAEQRVYGELYNSPAFLEAHRELQSSPPEPGCKLQRVVIALMFSSDETHLTQFGDTKLWPLYLAFGNDSKYCRNKPSLSLCNHVAYFAKLPETFKDFVRESNGGKGPTKSHCAHCQRELLHAQWKLLLDNEFMDAFIHGIVIKCCDRIEWRFYPRIFTYSADYKEKVILSGIRNLGTRLCPRCLIPKSQVYRMGMVQDIKARATQARIDNQSYRNKISTARDIIYQQNYSVETPGVKDLLKDLGLVPTENAFSAKLSAQGFNLFSMMVVDLMHEVESGNWRSLFIHILRILNSVNQQLIHDMDWRYRQVPTFGTDTIRKFRRNTSEMKNLAARDWEDMLQCAIPVFDGLLEGRGNSLLLDLLFIYAEWHGLAKLRVHTDETLKLLESATHDLGRYMRKFKAETSKLYATRELKKEVDARIRRMHAGTNQKKSTKKDGPESGSSAGKDNPSASQPRRKELNLETYKFHALGDYVEAIRRFGTTESYSTETRELEHRNAKSRYSRTSKKNFILQMTKIERRQARVRAIRQKLHAAAQPDRKPGLKRLPQSIDPEDPIDNSFAIQYVVGRGQNEPENLAMFMHKHSADPAAEGFLSKLKIHLLPRVCAALNIPHSRDPAKSGVSIFFQGDRMYRHRTIRFNYTTYDVRRTQDIVNPTKSQRNIMLLAEQTPATKIHSSHPFIYAQVLGIFHVNIVCMPTSLNAAKPWLNRTLRMDFLWVRWYQHHPAPTPYRLDSLTFPAVYEEEAFGFVDPKDVLRACHVIPAFRKGQFNETSLSEIAQDGSDWVEYYIGRFSDRDALMRYHCGMGIGHTYVYGGKELQDVPIDPMANNISHEGDDASHDEDTTCIQPSPDAEQEAEEDDLDQREDEDLGMDGSDSEEDLSGSDID